MLTAIQWIYDNGQIIWDETLPVQKRTKVIVTFLEENTPIHESLTKKDREEAWKEKFGWPMILMNH